MQLVRSTLLMACLSAAQGLGPAPIQMDVMGGQTRCLADTVRVGVDTTFEFKAVPTKGTSTENIRVLVEHPNGEEPWEGDLATKPQTHLVASDQNEGGFTYRVCFQSSQPAGSRARVELKETTVTTKEGPRENMPKHLQPVDELLQHANTMAQGLKEQLQEGESSESEWITFDRGLRSRINFVAGFTIFVLLFVSGWQLALLNKFFRSKKLI